MVRESHASHLDVVFNRNADFRADLQLALALAILGARACKNGFVVFGWAQGGLISHGPEFSRRCIAQINKSSPTIAGGILAPPGDGQIAPTAVAASGAGDCQVVTSVGQEVDLWRARVGGVEDSHLLLLPIQLPRSMEEWVEGWKDGRMEGWKDGRMEGWKDGRVEGWKDGRVEGCVRIVRITKPKRNVQEH